MKITKFKNLFLIFIFVFAGFTQIVWSQKKNSKKNFISYTAIVKNSNGTPIKNAKVFANEGEIKTFTDENGSFTISINYDSEILIESEGYNAISVNAMSKIQDIVLIQSPFLIGSTDIIPIAFRNIKKGLSIGNVSLIHPDDLIKNDNVTSTQELLDTYSTGLKGGYNLLGLGNALVIVDGLPRDASTLLPEEIEDISVLKDVNSTILYGSQAKNGVIIIKTKRGVANKKLMKMSFEKGINLIRA